MIIYVKNGEGVSLPERGSEVAAGYDIIATSEPKIVGTGIPPDGATSRIGYGRVDYIEYETNLSIAPSTLSIHTLIHPRSSISKYNLVLANSIGLVDNDYRGTILCRFKYVWQPEDFYFVDGKLLGNINIEKVYKKGDKIAQLIAEETISVEWTFADDLNKTTRGRGGFGSTDKQTEQLSQVAQSAKSSLLETYTKAGGVPVPLPYSERIKERNR